jgi:SPP1 gp7 family putative phage head morphogenesis protein
LYRLLSSKLVLAESKLNSAGYATLERILLGLEEAWDRQAAPDQSVLTQAFSHIDQATRAGLQKQMERLSGQSLWLGVFPTGLLDDFVDEHQMVIKVIQREHLDKIGLSLKRGIREGRLQKDIVKDIRQMTDMSKRRAMLIARNAPLQYSGALTRHHQTSAGIKQYRWQTSHDERVRASHRDRDGKVYAWDSVGSHPRSEVNCRCDAIPVLN